MQKLHTKKGSMQSTADAVGIAESTRLFSTERHIREEIAEKVREKAKEMNYAFNEVVRSLRIGRSISSH